jgi:putative transposase
VPHRKRDQHVARNPVHVTMRTREGLPSLRGDRLLLEAMRNAIGASEKDAFRVVHFSVQSNHLHLIVEAEDRQALSRGMQGLSIRMARAAHRALGHGGTIFSDRYHAHQLKTPRETRAALLYVLQNWAKHGRGGDYDPRSSAFSFDRWTRPPPVVREDPIVAKGRTWLVRVGWRRHGLLRPGERPGRAPAGGIETA